MATKKMLSIFCYLWADCRQSQCRTCAATARRWRASRQTGARSDTCAPPFPSRRRGTPPQPGSSGPRQSRRCTWSGQTAPPPSYQGGWVCFIREINSAVFSITWAGIWETVLRSRPFPSFKKKLLGGQWLIKFVKYWILINNFTKRFSF